MKKKITLLIILVILLVINTLLVMTNNTSSFDNLVYNWVFLLNSETNTKIMKFITFFGSTIWIVLFALALFIVNFKNKKIVSITIALMIGTSTILNNVIKVIVCRARPLYMVVQETTYSYPSGHMMASTTLYGLLIYLLFKSNVSKKYKVIYGIILLTMILAIGTSRIYLGAHFVTDIIGAALSSCILITILDILNKKYNLM